MPLLVGTALLLTQCNTSQPEVSSDSRFLDYITGFTTGIISKKDNLTIQFSELISLPEELPKGFFKISPSVDGELVKSGQSLVFSPKSALKSGKQYSVKLKLASLADVPEALKEFVFSVQTIPQDYEVKVDGLRTGDEDNPKVLQLTGTLNTADYVENEEAEKMLNVSGKEVEWIHHTNTSHQFAIKNIERGDEAYDMNITVSGSPIGVEKENEELLSIPSVKDFSITSTRVNKIGDAYVSLFFSDPLQANQNLEGLITLAGESAPKFVIDGNEVQVYLTRMLSGSRLVHIEKSIKNVFGHPLKDDIDKYLAFDPEDPQIKLIGKGTILPSTEGLVLPFEAVNLKSVRVDVVQVFEQNIPQFLQTNTITGSEQIKRTGRKVMKKTVDLSEYSKDLSNWNRFTLDLASLFETERGAIYQVKLSFRPEDSAYPCEEAFTSNTSYSKDETATWSIFDNDGFDYWGDYSSYYYPPGFRWDERDNPCHVSYYYRERFVTRNLIASDIGLIVKIGGDNSLNVYTTNMVSASPVAANIQVLDYQLQVMDEGPTSSEGIASFNPVRRPFLVIAESNGQKSYLKLDDGSSLTMSNFDVSGNRIRNGIKGFIYGERGVWRPGNDIFLSFMLEDIDDRISTDQPVIFEFRDPLGNLKDRQVATSSIENLYSFKTQTDPADVTGNWNATVTVGNASFSKRIKVETIKPNRLKIKLDVGVDKVTFENRNLTPKLSANWLTGIKGNNLKAETEVIFKNVNTTFEGYGNYEFDNPGTSTETDRTTVFKGNTDENGDVSFNYQMPVPANRGGVGALRATFETKVFEPGGDFSINTKSVTYYPHETYVGVQLPEGDEWGQLKRDSDHQANVVVLDGEGAPFASRNISMKVYKVNWRWWWDESDDYDINYIRSSNRNLVMEKTVEVRKGKGAATFSGDRWGRYLMILEDPVSGHVTGDYFYIGWGAEEQGQLGASFMSISTNKTRFEVGEDIALTIPGSAGAQALVSIENGSKVIQNFWTKTQDGNTTIKLKATSEMTPNIYAHVTLIQPHAQNQNDLPIRLYGIAPLKVLDKQTVLEPEIDMDDELSPGKEVEITVSEKNGKPMAYTIAVVDEGLLDITNFKTPDAWNHFYSREAIGVKTWDIYDEVIGAYGGRLERLLAIGGDGEFEADDEDGKKPDERFKPVVKFMGPFFTSGKSQTHSFTMPQYIGSVKTMVVAGLNGAYGKTDVATPVIKPLMVLGTLPRVTGPGEKIRLPVNVFRYRDNIKDAKVTIETEGLISVNGAKSSSVDLSSSANKVTYFDLEVARAVGKGKVTITAKGKGETAVHEITLESRAPNIAQTQVQLLTIDQGETFESELNTFGMDGTNTSMLEIARVPSMNLEKRLQYLIRYPHGCIEQTTSSVFPQLFLADITELSTKQQVRTQENIKKGIERLKKFQTTEGGFAYWPGQSDPNSWGTNYGYHFLIEAEKKGYFVPKELMKNLRKYQERKAKNWSKNSSYNDDIIQAYRLFTLALSGNAATSSMNRLLNNQNLSNQAQWRLGAAYSLIGKESVAKKLLTSENVTPSRYYWYSYGSVTRDQAMLLETYTYLGEKEKGFRVLKELAKSLSSERWYSTQTTAYALMSISKYLGGMAAGELNASVTYEGKTDKWTSELPILRASLNADAADKKLVINNESNGTLFLTLTTTGIPYPGEEPASNSGIGMVVDYYNQRGESIELSDIRQGQTFEASIRIVNENPGRIKDVALSQIFPSGWEINNDRLNETNTYTNSSFDYQDIRDDRIYTYFDLNRGASKTFKVRLTATYGGSFYLPGAYCEAMYDASLNAKSKGQWIEVK